MRYKSQSELMEYVFLTFFVVVLIFGIIFFLTYWQTSQYKIEISKEEKNKVLSIGEHFMYFPFLTKEKFMFDDSKLTGVLVALKCKDLERFFGTNWYVSIKIFDGKEKKLCTWSNYPDCNYWEFCKKENKPAKAYNFPVNIYRKIENRVDMGVMRVGVYE